MQPSRRSSLLAFEVSTPEIRRVLTDARCSYVDRQGNYLLVDYPHAQGQQPEASLLAERVLTGEGVWSQSTTIDLAAGRDGPAPGVLANPIELLHWLVAQPAADGFHPTVNAYIGSSDPDDILPFLPFHPASGAGATGTGQVAVCRVHLGGDASSPAGSVLGGVSVEPLPARAAGHPARD